MRRIFDETRQVIAIHELNNYFLYRKDIIRKVNGSFASNGFRTIQFEMMRAEMLGVCRLWDRSRDSCSLPAIAYQLRNALKKGCDWLSEIQANAVGGIREMREQEWKTRIEEACAETEKIASGDMASRMVNYRDKRLAHSLRQTHEEKKKKLLEYPLPQYGEEGELLLSAKKLVATFYSLVIDGYVNFPVLDEFYCREARWFAQSVNFLTTKEYNEELMNSQLRQQRRRNVRKSDA